jgi:chaperonin GroES
MSTSVPIKPLADRVVAVREEARKQTASGIYLPETAKEKPLTAVVKEVGPDVKHVKKGDKILYKQYGSLVDVKVGGNQYIILSEEDILATVTE